MRCFFALSFLLLVFAGQAQPWKSYTLNPYGDTLNRLDQKGLKQGPWVIHVDALRGEKGYDEQGFFVKHGDGGADIMPIAHLYKTQVYQLAQSLNIPKEIIERAPTSDTYSAEQTQEEFFFQLPFKEMDLIWYGFENGYEPSEVAATLEKSEEEIKAIYNNFQRKRKTTEYLRMSPITFC